MLLYTTNKFCGTRSGTSYDLHNLPLDGVLAHTMERADLCRKLSKMKVPNVKPDMGMNDLLLNFAEFRRQQGEAAK